MSREVVNAGAKPVGPYSQAVKAQGLVFTAGQLGIDPSTGQLVDGGIVAETGQALENLSSILAAAGSDLARAVKTTVYLVDMERDYGGMNSAYRNFFGSEPPARATVQVAALYGGAVVEIEVVATN